MKRLIIIVILSLLLAACRSQTVPPASDEPGETTPPPVTIEPDETDEPPVTDETPVTDEAPETAEPPEADDGDPAEQWLARLSLREMIGQLFIIRPDGLDLRLSRDQLEDVTAAGVTQLSPQLRQTLADYPVGGFVLFGKNLISPEQLAALQAELREASPVAPFMAIDEEGGLVSRLANQAGFDVAQFPDMRDIGATGEPEQAYQVGLTIGNYLRSYSFNLDFAPVADVDSNPANPVIGARAFSSDPAVVSSMVVAAQTGFQDAGMIACLKHFPGHGDTASDPHYDTASTAKTWAEMEQLELIPFQAGIAAGADMIMLGHILTPGVSDDAWPASLSPEIHRRLRQDLVFDGVVITDSLSMQAISNQYSPGEAALHAYLAGNDLLLMPAKLDEAFRAIEQAVAEGVIDQAELSRRVGRILRLKLKYGIM